MGEEETCLVLDELNLGPAGNSTFGEKLLIFSKEIRVEIQFGELSHKLIIKVIAVDKLPERKGVRREKAKIQDRPWQAHNEAVVE